MQRSNHKWIENLDLAANDKEIILSNQDLHDGVIGAAINLIQRQFPILVIQSPPLYFASGFEHCPYETIQIIHSIAHHWVFLSSFNGEVKVFGTTETTQTTHFLTDDKNIFTHRFQPIKCLQPNFTTEGIRNFIAQQKQRKQLILNDGMNIFTYSFQPIQCLQPNFTTDDTRNFMVQQK